MEEKGDFSARMNVNIARAHKSQAKGYLDTSSS